MKITYQEMPKQKTTTIRVKLDGKQIGKIKRTNRGWEYFPEGKRTGGAVFQTLAACKASLEETEPRYLGLEARKVADADGDGVPILHYATGYLPPDLAAVVAKGRMADGVPVPETIDITPAGYLVLGGGKRIIDAQREWDNATAKFANLAEQGIKAGWITFNIPFHADDWDDLHAAIKDRNDKQEAFLRAVAGVPE